ncbi:MAG: MarR family transcriptional regulator [Sporolactobacillus sp.]
MTDEKKRELAMLKIERELAILIRRFRKDINGVHSDKITGHEFMFLKILSKGEFQTASAIAKEFEVSPSYATIVIDKLIRQHLVSRQRSTSDRRIVELTVTSHGNELLSELGRVRREYMYKVFGKINDDELEHLAALLDKLI